MYSLSLSVCVCVYRGTSGVTEILPQMTPGNSGTRNDGLAPVIKIPSRILVILVSIFHMYVIISVKKNYCEQSINFESLGFFLAFEIQDKIMLIIYSCWVFFAQKLNACFL